MFAVKRQHHDAQLPFRKRDDDAGYDVFAYLTEGQVELAPGERVTIPTGIAVSVPKTCVIQIWPRSGLADRQGLDTLAGVVDSSFCGEIKVILINLGTEPIVIKHGERVAQLLLVQLCEFPLVEQQTLSDTDRGAQGFGSSGK